jgi:uncharacterized protein
VKVVHGTQIVVVAKEPVPGRVKTRLCPPCTGEQAARVAAAALADTIDAVCATETDRRVLLIDGGYEAPPGWRVVRQRGTGLAERLANGFADTAGEALATVLIGMDTPQVTPALLDKLTHCLSKVDSVLGPARDGGWWALALRDHAHGQVLARVRMSRSDTGERTVQALRARGATVALAEPLRDIDTYDDLYEVARQCPRSRVAEAARALGLE